MAMTITKYTRWRCFAGYWLQSLCTSSMNLFSLFAIPLMTDCNWTNEQFSAAYTIYMVTYCAVGFFGGILTERFGPRKTLYCAMLFYVSGWFLAGFADNLPQLYLTFGLGIGIGGGIMYAACLPTTLKWFPDKTGIISGLAMTGATVGPIVFAPFVADFIEKIGPQNTLHLLGIIFFIFLSSTLWMITSCPLNWRPKNLQERSEITTEIKTNSFTPLQMLKTPIFWLLFIIFIAPTATGTMLVSAVSPIAQRQLGQTAMFGAFCVSVLTCGSLTGRVLFGLIYDKLKSRRSLALVLLINLIAMLMLTVASNSSLFLLSIFLCGISFGSILVVIAPTVLLLFGGEHYNSNYGLMFMGYGLGALIGPWLAANSYDATGGYWPCFVSSAVLAAIGLLMVFFTRRAALRLRTK